MGWAPEQEMLARRLIPMPDPAQGRQQRFFTLFVFPCFFLALLFVLLLGRPTWGWSAVARPEAGAPFFKQPADFNDCAKLALRQSPFFTKSSLEIEIRKLDEADSKADYFPSLHVSAKYYPSQPDNPDVSDPLNYSVAFTTGDYNPLVAHLSLKAKKLITRIAALAHLKVISAGLQRLGKAFLELNASQRLAQLQGTLVDLAEENLRYVRERQKLGEITPMEVQIASQEVVVAQAERKTVEASQGQIREAIRNFLALEPHQPLRLELNQASSQVLAGFDPAQTSLEKAQERDFDVRIKQLSQELQAWMVTLAKMKFMPSFNFTLETPDPVSSNINRGTFFSMGIKFPIFEGFKRTRDIKRQKTILQQFASEEEVKESEITQNWRKAQESLKTSTTALELAQAQAELAELKERQAETLYRTGGENFSVFLAARQARVKAQKKAVQAALEHDLALLELRHLSGDLVYSYAHENRFQ